MLATFNAENTILAAQFANYAYLRNEDLYLDFFAKTEWNAITADILKLNKK